MNNAIKEYRWTLTEAPDQSVAARLSREINIPEPLAHVLVLRGVDTYDSAKAFFRPTVDQLHDPFLLDGMHAAVDRLIKALQEGEKILVFGDYDVDGTNGAAMLYLFLRELGGTVEYYVPDRIEEGYGISRQGIDRAARGGVQLFLSVDCGITAVEPVEYANQLGLDVIICDHHEPGPILPPALAVLDPLKKGDAYPFKHLCGCGVGFKLIEGLARKVGKETEVFSYLDFVALASTADIVPLTGENRVMTRLGLETINARPRSGLKALIRGAGLHVGDIATGQIVFVLGPRINAAGRLGDARRAVRLLTCTDPVEAEELAAVLEQENVNRRKIDEDTFANAQHIAESQFDLETDPAIVLHQNEWHPGVVGIVASRMVEKYYKPSIMMATVDGVAKGSARSVSGFDIFAALRQCEDVIIQFGGHKYAAGLTVDIGRLDEFRNAFNKAVHSLMTEELRTREIRIDAELSLRELTPRFMRILKEFGPFGPSNLKPTFVARNLQVVGTPRIVGKNHLRFKVRQDGTLIDAIGFGLGEHLQRVSGKKKDLECVFTVDENSWVSSSGERVGNGQPQLKIKDLH